MNDTAKAADNDASTSLVERVYRLLRRDIIEGKYAPGSKLRIEHLKKEYGIGGGTCREALTLLQSDWLVTLFGHGFRVSDISYEDFVDITNTRIKIEVDALRQSIEHGDERWEADVVAASYRLKRADEAFASSEPEVISNWEERHKTFHEVLISACPSRWMKQFSAILYSQAERYRRLMLAYIDTEDSPIQREWSRHKKEHADICDAVLARNVDLAAQRLTDHIRGPLLDIKELPPFGQAQGTARPRKRISRQPKK